MATLTRDKIVTVAEQLITETGDPAITLSQISDRLGITHAALYKHFQNKQALWEAVTANWFQREIIANIQPQPAATRSAQLRSWLWAFANAKKFAASNNPAMFALNTHYVDNNPVVLRRVLIPAFQAVATIMDYHDPDDARAEAILSAFAVFTLPAFKDSWQAPDYAQRFEQIWQLIEPGL